MAAEKNILILCSRLDAAGGIERAITKTANLLHDKGHSVFILILDVTDASFFPLAKTITVATKGINFGISKRGNFILRKLNFLKHVKTLKQRIIELAPDLILTTEYPFTIAAVLAAKKLNTRIVAWEHHHYYHLPKSGFWKLLYKWAYPKTSGVVCLNDDEAKLYQSIQCKTWVIPNFIEQQKKAELKAKTLLTVGWLSNTKGVDFIPSIAEKVFAKHSGWKWKIIGSGEEENKLKRELQQKNLDKYFSIITPSTHQLENDYLESSIYVMTSRFECFPMVLLEAMAHGLPCVAFNCPTGPKHIINDKENGLLVNPNDIDAMANAIDQLIINEEERMQLGANAQESTWRLHPDSIYKLWEHVIG